jgi:hypothetical protein
MKRLVVVLQLLQLLQKSACIAAEDMIWVPPRVMGHHVSKHKHHLTRLVDDSIMLGGQPIGDINETQVAALLKKLLDAYDIEGPQAELERLEALHDRIQADPLFDQAWALTPGMVSMFASAKSAAQEEYVAAVRNTTANVTDFTAAHNAAAESVDEVLSGTWPASKLMMASALAAKAVAEAIQDAEGEQGEQLYAAAEAAAQIMMKRKQGWAMAAETAAKAVIKAGGTDHDARQFAAEIAARVRGAHRAGSIADEVLAGGALGDVGKRPVDKARAVSAAFDISLAAGEEKRDALELAQDAVGLSSRKQAKQLLLMERRIGLAAKRKQHEKSAKEYLDILRAKVRTQQEKYELQRLQQHGAGWERNQRGALVPERSPTMHHQGALSETAQEAALRKARMRMHAVQATNTSVLIGKGLAAFLSQQERIKRGEKTNREKHELETFKHRHRHGYEAMQHRMQAHSTDMMQKQKQMAAHLRKSIHHSPAARHGKPHHTHQHKCGRHGC